MNRSELESDLRFLDVLVTGANGNLTVANFMVESSRKTNHAEAHARRLADAETGMKTTIGLLEEAQRVIMRMSINMESKNDTDVK